MRTAVRAEINVTPLVDVCLVLLIIFMVVTPLFNAVRLPAAPEPELWGTEPARSKILLSYGPPRGTPARLRGQGPRRDGGNRSP